MTKDILRIEGNIDDVCDMVRRLPVFNHAGSVTLRDQFAMAALTGLLANPKLQPEISKTGGAYGGWIEGSAWSWADAMMEKRK
jgi:hypothetical protein